MEMGTVLLGLLTERSCSGYDLKKLIDRRAGYFFGSPGHSAIYPVLKDLRCKGFVRMDEVTQEGRPDKKIYSITPEGGAHLLVQLAQEPAADRYRSELLVRLFFGEKLSPEKIQGWLRERRTTNERRIRELRKLEWQTVRAAQVYGSMCLRFELYMREAEANWLDECVRTLAATGEAQTGKSPSR